MIKLRHGAIFAATIAVASFAGVNALAAEKSNQQDLGTFSCKYVMRLSGEDRDLALALAHGYVLGKKGVTKYDVEVLAQITDKFLDYCLDHPKEMALPAFEKIAK